MLMNCACGAEFFAKPRQKYCDARCAERQRYAANPEKYRAKTRSRYAAKPQAVKALEQMRRAAKREERNALNQKALTKCEACPNEFFARGSKNIFCPDERCRAARARVQSSEWYAANTERANARSRLAYASNKESILAEERQRRIDNPDEERAKRRLSYARNREKILARATEYYWANREKVLAKIPKVPREQCVSCGTKIDNPRTGRRWRKRCPACRLQKRLDYQYRWAAANAGKVYAQKLAWQVRSALRSAFIQIANLKEKLNDATR